jgi:hypothetical protein
MDSIWRFKYLRARKKVVVDRRVTSCMEHVSEHRYFLVLPEDFEIAKHWPWCRDQHEDGWIRVHLFRKRDKDEWSEWTKPDDHLGVCGHCGCRYCSCDAGTLYCSEACKNAVRNARNPKPKVKYKNIRCGHCGHWFMPNRSTAKFCSTKCRVAANRAKASKKKTAKKRRVRATD